MPKGFAYKWPITKNSPDSAGWSRTIIENFKDLLVFINNYVVTKEIDGTTVVIEDLSLLNGLDGTNEHIHMFRNAAQNLTGGAWQTIAVNAVVGTPGATFIADSPNNEVDTQRAGVFLVLGQVEFDATEAGDLRITANGTEIARAPYSRTGGQVTAIVPAITGIPIKMQAFNVGAATVNAGSNASYLKVVRLFALG